MPDTVTSPSTLLFTPLQLRALQLKNRIVISPMCQYSAKDGIANDWHMVHLGQYATGGAGTIIVEATAVQAAGRITHGDLGLWSDAHVAPLRRITDFIKANGTVPAIQLAHAGRKASMQRPWFGNGPLTQEDFARGDLAWPTVGASAEPIGPGWITPAELSETQIAQLIEDWRSAAARALAAGFDIAEVHGAHGYLLHSFCSPLANKRSDRYGGSLANRMRLPLAVTRAVREAWPEDKPLFYRVSSTDNVEGGWTVEDSIALARELKVLGVDVIDCSSGGIAGSATAANTTSKRTAGFQVPFAQRIRAEAGVMTQAVGVILTGAQAEAILQAGQADLIAVGREALFNPHWANQAARELGVDPTFAHWPKQYGWWLNVRQKTTEGLLR